MKKFLLTAATAIFMAATAQAATVTIGTDQALVSPGRDNQGWWSSAVINNNGTNDNYITGPSGPYRSYFTFDLSALVGQVITALTFNVRRYDQFGTPTISFWDVSTSAANLAQRLVADAGIFADLGSGGSYGSYSPAAGNSFDVLSFALNGAAVADANNAVGGYFSIGASVVNGTMFSRSGDEPGNGGPGYTQDLVVQTQSDVAVVPLPASLPLFLAGLAAFGWLRQRKNRLV